MSTYLANDEGEKVIAIIDECGIAIIERLTADYIILGHQRPLDCACGIGNGQKLYGWHWDYVWNGTSNVWAPAVICRACAACRPPMRRAVEIVRSRSLLDIVPGYVFLQK